ncbi:hypothetical protein Bra3105_06630 [Brachybacterium halotolerans subsp. kimchii]|uniref:hypothetical protein n=1 Tax=Brachybacterium halotolerans TaxID=2795215 RepID=UPI001E2F066C|nr:hypothetical protein [Brachybacterium halotolerans]UEJ83982.1 hypothetical protein Bra3105_06630 [Brachybacterium halotolerans subsp. kimchii]
MSDTMFAAMLIVVCVLAILGTPAHWYRAVGNAGTKAIRCAWEWCHDRMECLLRLLRII